MPNFIGVGLYIKQIKSTGDFPKFLNQMTAFANPDSRKLEGFKLRG